MSRNMVVFLGMALIFSLIGAGVFFSQRQQDPNVTEPFELLLPQSEPSHIVGVPPIPLPSDTLQGTYLAQNYYTFTQVDYDELRTSGMPVLLFFYANWCPTCALQDPVMIEALNIGISQGIVTLRVNYNDSDTDPDEKRLAQEFAVTYQHTFVGINLEGQTIITVNGQQSETDLASLFSQLASSAASL